MRLMKMEKVKDGRYLKNYELTYENKAGKEKRYEIVSRKELACVEEIGNHNELLAKGGFYAKLYQSQFENA